MKNISIRNFLKLNEENQKIYLLLHKNIKIKIKKKHEINIDKHTYIYISLVFNSLKELNNLDDILFFIFKFYNKKRFFWNYYFFLNQSIFYFLSLKDYFEKYFITLKKNEIKLLSSNRLSDDDWQMAGGNKLDKYGQIVCLSQLAKIYGGYPFDYQHRKYIEIISLLSINKIQNDIEYNLNKNIK